MSKINVLLYRLILIIVFDLDLLYLHEHTQALYLLLIDLVVLLRGNYLINFFIYQRNKCELMKIEIINEFLDGTLKRRFLNQFLIIHMFNLIC